VKTVTMFSNDEASVSNGYFNEGSCERLDTEMDKRLEMDKPLDPTAAMIDCLDKLRGLFSNNMPLACGYKCEVQYLATQLCLNVNGSIGANRLYSTHQALNEVVTGRSTRNPWNPFQPLSD